MKILVIMTGGTIGSRLEAGAVRTDTAASDYLLKLYGRQNKNTVVFEVIRPYYILSENCSEKNWERLSSLFHTLDLNDYDGIIVTHGSDTISYTSAFLGLLYGGGPVPVVVTGSSHPLHDPRGNGLANFSGAVDFIRTARLRGVFTLFQNEIGETEVFLSTRIMAADSCHDQFSGFGGHAFGTMDQGRFVPSRASVNPSSEEFNSGIRGFSVKEQIRLRKPVYVLSPYPGFDYRMIDLSRKPAAVLQLLYHSATACVDGEGSSILEFIASCRQLGIPVYTCSNKKQQEIYETGKRILEAGAVPLFHMSQESAYAKLLIAYNQTEMPLERYMSTNWFFEELS